MSLIASACECILLGGLYVLAALGMMAGNRSVGGLFGERVLGRSRPRVPQIQPAMITRQPLWETDTMLRIRRHAHEAVHHMAQTAAGGGLRRRSMTI